MVLSSNLSEGATKEEDNAAEILLTQPFSIFLTAHLNIKERVVFNTLLLYLVCVLTMHS